MNPITRKTVKEATKVLPVALFDVPANLGAVSRIRHAYQIGFQRRVVGMTVQWVRGSF